MKKENPPIWAEVLPLFGRLLVITDPGRDQDDEDVLTQLNRYVRLGNLSVLGVVANLAPSLQRGRLARGTLNMLLPDHGIEVGAGSSCLQPDDDGLNYQFEVEYLAHERDIVSGPELIERKLLEARPKSVVLLLLSGMTDAARALDANPDLFKSRVRRVVIMGGVEADGDVPRRDENGFYLPDLTAQNNKFDIDSAKYLHRALQMLGIATTVVSRHTATTAKVSREMYDRMADTGHPVGTRLRDAQRLAIEHLWKRACAVATIPNPENPDGKSIPNPARAGLPERCDKAWFIGAFCGGEGSELTAEDSVWPCIKTFNLYDPVTLVAAIPALRGYFYRSVVLEVHGVEHHLIGVSVKNHGVINPEELATYLADGLVQSLEMSMADQRLQRRTA